MNDPVTIVVRRRVKPGREKDYEAWLERLSRGAVDQFAGYLGAEFHRPASPGGRVPPPGQPRGRVSQRLSL